MCDKSCLPKQQPLLELASPVRTEEYTLVDYFQGILKRVICEITKDFLHTDPNHGKINSFGGHILVAVKLYIESFRQPG